MFTNDSRLRILFPLRLLFGPNAFARWKGINSIVFNGESKFFGGLSPRRTTDFGEFFEAWLADLLLPRLADLDFPDLEVDLEDFLRGEAFFPGFPELFRLADLPLRFRFFAELALGLTVGFAFFAGCCFA